MYGMINQALDQLITANYGADRWTLIKNKAKCDVDYFVSNESYPDALTYDLVSAASEVLGVASDDLLFAFGEFWVLHTAQIGYGDLLKSAGRDLGEFLAFLPSFHIRVALIYPHLVPPRFEISDYSGEKITMHYYSHRPGLSPMVLGLFSGIAKMYGTDAETEQIQFKEKGDDHDVFLVKWGREIQA